MRRRRPTTPGRIRRSQWLRRMWRRCRRPPSVFIKIMQPSSSTTKSSQKVAHADWKKRVPSELQQMQEEASSHNTDLLRDVASVDSMVVRATDGTETLLKHALPVPRGSAEPKAKLTRPPVPLHPPASRLQSKACRPALIFFMNENEPGTFIRM